MPDLFEEKARLEMFAERYAASVRAKTEKLRSSLGKDKYDFLTNRWSLLRNPVFRKLEAALGTPGVKPSEYVADKLGWMFGEAIPEKEKPVIMYFADRLREYPYSVSCGRRSFRSKDYRYCAEKLVHVIQSYSVISGGIIDMPLEKILGRELPEDVQAYIDRLPWGGCGYNRWQIAYALDHGERGVEEAVRRIITEENGGGMMTAELILGALISHREDFYELIGKLLLAAKLQEGLRQIICESADSGTKAAFLHILKIIDENNLIRFSSVKRAVGTWLGILPEESRDLERVSQKSVRMIIGCLSDEKCREECLDSEDAMAVYIALWSCGFDDISDSIVKITRITEKGSLHQVLVCGYFAENIGQPYLSNTLAKAVLKKYGDRKEALAVWMPSFLPGVRDALMQYASLGTPPELALWFDGKKEACEFYGLIKSIYNSFESKTVTFSPCIFPWYEAKISVSKLAEALCALAVLSDDGDKQDEACSFVKECAPENRGVYFSALLRNPSTAIRRTTLIEGIADRETYTRKAAYDAVSKLTLRDEEYRKLEEYLRFKSADIRKNTMELLMKQDDGALRASISRLLDSRIEDVRLGGMDMLLQLGNSEKRRVTVSSFEEALRGRAESEDLTEKEKNLLGSLLPEKTGPRDGERQLFEAGDAYLPDSFDDEYTALCAKTFGEYFPESELPDMIGKKKSNNGLPGRIKKLLTDKTCCVSAITAARDLMSLSALIDAHKTDTFVGWDGDELMLGTVTYSFGFCCKDGSLPLPELWRKWIGDNGITNKRILNAHVLSLAYSGPSVYAEASTGYIRTVFGSGFECGRKLPYSGIISAVLNRLTACIPEEELTRLGAALAIWFVRCVPDDKVLLPSPNNSGMDDLQVSHLLGHAQLSFIYGFLKCKNDGELKNTFPPAVASAERCIEAFRKINRNNNTENVYFGGHYGLKSLHAPCETLYAPSIPLPDIKPYLFAAYRGIITLPQLYEFIMRPENIHDSLEVISAAAVCYYENGRQISTHNTFSGNKNGRVLKELFGTDAPDETDGGLIRMIADIYEKTVSVILSEEFGRGDTPVRYSAGVKGIARIYGSDYFARLLSAMGSDTIDRSAYWGWSNSSDRRSSLSYLLSVCIPAKDDTAETLRAALSGKKITEKRLIEAALYSPEWIPIIGDYLGIGAFESVCYYFIAHMNEQFDDKRKAIIAKYTPLSEEELNLGAFDINWFRSAYGSIGRKEFDLIYDAAKYISDSAKHTRARKYADASLGKTSVDEAEKAISAKRNKDLLMAYSLIPLGGEDDILRRYLFIQQFRRESKQFGSLRATGESKAADTALTNLAINAGYADTMRLTLRMETKVIDDSRKLMDEAVIDGVSVKITLDENGKAALLCSRDGKPLKSIPAKLKKCKDVSERSLLVKTLTEQYRRTVLMLERAMEDGAVFTHGELSALSDHPVVYPMMKNLVLNCGNRYGFLAEQGLRDASGSVIPLDDGDKVIIAHPFDMYSAGCWRDYQKYLFDNRTVQPFRQVFRELYVKTDEEKEALHSLRYSGNQVQPAKTVAVLKSRRWVADVENGLQKVYYKDNIVARIYAVADWFSPADIEAPTLEWVCFEDRRTGAEIKIRDVPDVIFSEVMRDTDLAVSVAHAGGVDPETSHSTVEMRASLLSFVLPMFGIGNVRVEGRRAIIEGSLAEYTVHLGSGTVHQLGGAMIPVLPVHSQHKGRIFLPFADDDPKTAEIISKVLLFAEDGRIKDPMILSCIKK